MTTFGLHHRQFPTPFLSSTSPFLRPKPTTTFLSSPLTLAPLFPFPLTLPRPTASPPVVSSMSRYAFNDSLADDDDEDDEFLTKFNKPEPEDVARGRSWTERGWAPWEEILSTEADFARKSLDEGEEVPLTTPEAVEAFNMLTPAYRKKKIAEIGEEEYLKRLFAIKGEIPEKLQTIWAAPLALQLVPPRDWPPKGWEVDNAELEFIREAHKLQSVRVDIGGGGNGVRVSDSVESFLEGFKEVKEILDGGFGEYEELWTKFKQWAEANPERLKMDDARFMMGRNDFMKQYKEWVEANRDGGGSEEGGEGIGDDVEKAVKRYEEFLKQSKENANANADMAEQEARDAVKEMAFERYNVFLKQYTKWVDANRERLEEESYKFDQDYYPGRRKRGKDYKEEMLELPFIYPGQIYQGKVTSVSLYQGAFVDIGCVHDGWVPIKGNDWYWIRHHIKVGMHVLVEILVKRDPYRYRFPIEMRFLQPNIDHLIFNKFDFPPVFHRDEDMNPHELQRESGRELIPKKRPEVQVKAEELALVSDHPYVDELWHIHNAEQMILDHEEENPDEYKDKKFEEIPDPSFDEANTVEFTQEYYKDTLLPKTILKTNLKDLDMDAARAERQRNNRLRKEAEERGEKFEISKLRRNLEMDEYDLLHWQRSLEEREALIRDISCRTAVGLPLEEPGKYIDDPKFWGKEYDESNPVYRNDYWGDTHKIAKKKKKSEIEAQYRSVLGGMSSKWYETSLKGLLSRNARREEAKKKKEEEEELGREEEEEEEDVDDYEDDIDFDYGVFDRRIAVVLKSKPVVNQIDQPKVNGTSE